MRRRRLLQWLRAVAAKQQAQQQAQRERAKPKVAVAAGRPLPQREQHAEALHLGASKRQFG